MNPTREQFEMAAKAAKIVGQCWGAGDEVWFLNKQSNRPWYPHIPGVDNAMLAAAALGEYRTTSTEYGCIVHVGDSHHVCEYFDFTGTKTERRAKAMAWATFLVAVEIGKRMK